MANFTYHPPTRTQCPICEKLVESKTPPIIQKVYGKASSASSFPVHNWFYFVLGYTPEFPNYVLEREQMTPHHLVVDPFMGAGTTLAACKTKGIPSAGVDANDYFIDVVRTKVAWDIDLGKAMDLRNSVVECLEEEFRMYTSSSQSYEQTNLFSSPYNTWEEYAAKNRSEMLTQRYMSDIPFAKLHIIKQQVARTVKDLKLRAFFDLAVSSIVVPVSNVRYGPGFGVSKAKTDVDVLSAFVRKLDRMLLDMNSVDDVQRRTPVEVKHGDSRQISSYFEPDSVDLMITSPPYPGDHEYTKHTRLELIFMGYATNIEEFRTIKKRMIRGSTTNIYKGDRDAERVKHMGSIQKIVDRVDTRLKNDGATSGFEKLYTKLIWEYFGGMHKMLAETKTILKPGRKISLLVSDSHAFKMVHILTADILAEIGLDVGFGDAKIELWQDKVSTSHKYHLRENIVTLTK